MRAETDKGGARRLHAHHKTNIILGEIHHGRVEIGPLVKGIRDHAHGERGRRLFAMVG